MKQLFQKIHNRRGETMIEALVALVIVVLAISLLSTALSTAARINHSNNAQVKSLSVIGGGVATPADTEGLSIQTANIDNLTYNGQYQGGDVQITVIKSGETLDPSTYTLQFNTTSNDANWTTVVPEIKDAGQPLTVQVKITLSDGAEYLKTYTLSVQPRHVTLTSGNGSTTVSKLPADGFTVETVTVGGAGFVTGESANYTFTPIKEKGTASNVFTYELVNAKESNYEIELKYGILTVLEEDGMVVQASADSYVYDYDPDNKNQGPGTGDIHVYYDGNEITDYTLSYSLDGNLWSTTTGLSDPCVNTPLVIQATKEGYGSSHTQVTVTINKLTPSVTPPQNLVVTVGTKLSDVSLATASATVNGTKVSGTLAWDDSSVSVPLGGGSYNATFTPDNTTIYNTVSVQVPVATILTPEVTWPTPGKISYGQSLSSVVLSGGSAAANGQTVEGTFSWSTPDVKPNAGSQSYQMTFVPKDTAKYTSVTGTVIVNVDKITPSADEIKQAVQTNAITQGNTPNNDTFKNRSVNWTNTYNNESVTGTLSWVNATAYEEYPSSGTWTYTAKWTPTDAFKNNYNESAPFSVTVSVNKSDLQKALDKYREEMATAYASNLVYEKYTDATYEDTHHAAQDTKIYPQNGVTYWASRRNIAYNIYYKIAYSNLQNQFAANNYKPSKNNAGNVFMTAIDAAIEASFTGGSSSKTVSYTPEGGKAVSVVVSNSSSSGSNYVTAVFTDSYKNTKTLSYKITSSTTTFTKTADISGFYRSTYSERKKDPSQIENWDSGYTLSIKASGTKYTYHLSEVTN